jgi:peptidoglycan/LPS O-acetylase OafA/YrhL
VLAAVFCYGLLVLFPTELSQLGRHVAASAGFVANLLSWSEAGYFDRAAASKPLLHLWSLGVEEQFYIVWPLALWACRRAGMRLLPAIAAITLVSFGLNLLLSWRDVTADFYAPFTRVWELSLGALLAAPRPPAALVLLSRSTRARDTASICGLLLIVAAAALLDPAMRFPGMLALLPTVGAVLLIAAGPAAWANRAVLSRRAAVAVGLISYPLYLWHWPLLSYATIVRRGRAPKPLVAAGLIAAALLLSWATYRWIERPARFGRHRAAITLLLVVAVGTIGGVGAFGWAAGGFHRPDVSGLNPGQVDARRIDAAIGEGYFKPTPSMRLQEIDKTYIAEIGDAGGPGVLFIGDSLAFQYGPRIERLLAEHRLARTVYFVVGASCAPMPGILKTGYFAHCRDLPRIAHDLLQRRSIGSVVLAAFWPGYNGAPITVERAGNRQPIASPAGVDAVYANLDDEVRGLRDSGHAVYLVLTPPVSDRFDPQRMLNRSPFGFSAAPQLLTGVPVTDLRAVGADADRRLVAIAARTGAGILDPLPDICGAGPTCSAFFGQGEPKFADGKHLRPGFAAQAITVFDPLLTH